MYSLDEPPMFFVIKTFSLNNGSTVHKLGKVLRLALCWHALSVKSKSSLESSVFTQRIIQSKPSHWRYDGCVHARAATRKTTSLTPHLPSLEQAPPASRLFVLSKFLYIFCLKVTHCQLAVCPAHIWLHICNSLHLNLWHVSITSSVCAREEKNAKNIIALV